MLRAGQLTEALSPPLNLRIPRSTPLVTHWVQCVDLAILQEVRQGLREAWRRECCFVFHLQNKLPLSGTGSHAFY